ncbi:MAG: hypothetical protein V3T86_07125, partial [Planctomycetota bacterium]
MFNGSEVRSGILRAPRVLFDLNCLVIAAAAFLTLSICNWLLGGLFDVANPFGQVLTDLSLRLRGIGVVSGLFSQILADIRGHSIEFSLPWWQTAMAAAVWLAVWSFFGAALLRTAALRLTRDEPISLRRAFFFARRHFVEFFGVPLLLVLFVGAFAFATFVLGFLANIPIVGALFFLLAALCAIMVAFSLIGGLIALPVMWAALATELNGPLDALSRAFSYLFARPMQFLLGYMLLFVLMSLVLLFGSTFEESLKPLAGSALISGDLREAVVDKKAFGVEHPAPWTLDIENPAVRSRLERVVGVGERGLSDLDNDEGLGFWKVQFWLFWGVLALFAVLFKS